MPKFKGFTEPESNFFRLPNEWINLSSEMTCSEMRVVLYILRHTWGFNEYKRPKRITIDEFVNGRKMADGSRMDKGCGLSKRAVINGIQDAVKHGYIKVFRDERDKARIKCMYQIVMESEVHDMHSDNYDENFEVHDVSPDVHDVSPDVHNMHSDCARKAQRSEKDTLESNFRKTPKKKDTMPLVAAERRASGMETVSEGFFSSDKLPKDGCQIAAEKLYNKLLEKGMVNKRKSNVKRWANTIRKFLDTNNHIEKLEFKKVMLWYLKAIGGEYVPEVYSAEGFCNKYLQIRSAMIRDGESPVNKKVADNHDTLGKFATEVNEIYADQI